MKTRLVWKNEGFDEAYFARVREVAMRKAASLYGEPEESGGTLTVVLRRAEGLPEDGYRITGSPGLAVVEAGTRLGIISGAGRLLEQGDTDTGTLAADGLSCTFAPRCDVYGVYFASHFGNYYVKAPAGEIIRYVEELALWGSRLIRVWFDFHDYTGIDDPAAQELLSRLELILKTGRYFGMKIGYVSLSNEGYSTTPDEMKAEWWPQNGYTAVLNGHYHTEICPNKPGGIEKIIENRLGLFDRFSETPPDLMVLGLYDQGGCTCAKCAPWAANGYIKTLKAQVPILKARYPQCKIGFGAWYVGRFYPGEWDPVYRAFEEDAFLRENIDYIGGINSVALPKNPVYAEKIRGGHGPGDKPLLGFPEISMFGCSPWGGFGANPYPVHLQEDWDAIGRVQAGMWCYSEGRFEDINKYIVLGLYSGRFATADDAMRGYVRAEFSKRYEDDIMRLLRMLERTLPRTWDRSGENTPEGSRFVLKHPGEIGEAAALAQKIDKLLPERIRTGWRWRLVYVRAMADFALVRSGGFVRGECENCLAELADLYYTDDTSDLRPPIGISRLHKAAGLAE